MWLLSLTDWSQLFMHMRILICCLWTEILYCFSCWGVLCSLLLFLSGLCHAHHVFGFLPQWTWCFGFLVSWPSGSGSGKRFWVYVLGFLGDFCPIFMIIHLYVQKCFGVRLGRNKSVAMVVGWIFFIFFTEVN